jgi:polar amino acid transport system substrate-binding protein
MKKSILLVITLVVFSLSLPVHADTITIVADPWMPYTGEEGGEEPGFMVEFAQEILGKAGHKVVYKSMDWDKALEETREGRFDGVVATDEEESPGFIFPENELGMMANHFFVLKGNDWKFTGIESLKGKKIGVMASYSYGDKYDTFFKGNPNVVVASKLINLLEMLSEKTIDTIIEDHNVFMLLALQSYMIENIADAGSDKVLDPLYIGFSPKNPKSQEYAKILSAGMEELRKKGTLQIIMSRYGLSDWK